jgi:hypothetical protein
MRTMNVSLAGPILSARTFGAAAGAHAVAHQLRGAKLTTIKTT